MGASRLKVTGLRPQRQWPDQPVAFTTVGTAGGGNYPVVARQTIVRWQRAELPLMKPLIKVRWEGIR